MQAPDPIFDERGVRLGDERTATLLLFHGDTWCHRIVAKLNVIDEASLRWSFSNDFTVPDVDDDQGDHAEMPVGASHDELDTCHVPLVVIPKKKIAGIDIVDECGRSLPALNRNDEILLLLNSLLRLWREYTGGELRNHIVRFVERFPSGGQMLVTTTMEQVLTELLAFEPSKAVRRLAWIRASGVLNELQDPQRRRYFEDALRTMAVAGVIYATVQNVTRGERRIIKVSFERPASEISLSSHRRQLRDQRPTTIVQRIHDAVDLVLQSVGMRSTPFIWRLPTTRGSASYHFEATAPDGLMFIDSLLADGSKFSTLLRDRWWSERFHVRRLDSGNPASRRIHLYRRHEKGDRDLLHALYLRTPPVAWLLSATVATFIVALALTLISVGVYHLAGIDRATTVASAMLALGAVSVVALVRPLEHSFTSKVLRGARLAVGLSATASLVAIAYLLQVRAPSGPKAPVHVGDFAAARWYLIAAAWSASATLLAVFVSWPFSNWRLRRSIDRATPPVTPDGLTP